MNKFQNLVRKIALDREKEEFEAFEKEHGTFDDHMDVIETEVPGMPWTRIDFVAKDQEGYDKWSSELDKLKTHKQFKREVKAELKRGPRL